MDTGKNVPESRDTLLYQQGLLLQGKRDVQMFPVGTKELPLPEGMERVKNHRGVFHYNPKKILPEQILLLSERGRENLFLMLGPFDKAEVERRIRLGEPFLVLTEFTPKGVEVRSASGTLGTLFEQLRFFNETKEEGNIVRIGVLPQRLKKFEVQHA